MPESPTPQPGPVPRPPARPGVGSGQAGPATPASAAPAPAGQVPARPAPARPVPAPPPGDRLAVLAQEAAAQEEALAQRLSTLEEADEAEQVAGLAQLHEELTALLRQAQA